MVTSDPFFGSPTIVQKISFKKSLTQFEIYFGFAAATAHESYDAYRALVLDTLVPVQVFALLTFAPQMN